MSHITLVPAGGLCNRINAITSAIHLLQTHQIPIDIYWEKNKECNANFDDLFEPIKDFTIHPLKKMYLKPGRKKNLYFPNLLKRFYFDGYYWGHQISEMDIMQLLKNERHIYICSHNRFWKSEFNQLLSTYFVPIRQLNDRIREIVDDRQNNMIGVHIRRTDNIAAIKNNPIRFFYTQMDLELSKNENVFFYLATDSMDVKNKMKKRYQDKIITQELDLSRNSVKGMQDAVVDLYCLASANKIIGCNHSTYSTVAASIFGRELIM